MAAPRTLPGIAFRVETPLQVSLPRMDIAAFVGFAPRGPLHLPVVVESYPDFVNLFGGLYRLAWDGEYGLWQTAGLAPAVQAFFAQGGRRCWVVRVADAAAAATTVFPLTGLVQTTPLGGYTGVGAIARCPGSWADDWQTQVELLVTPVAFAPVTVEPPQPLMLSLQTPGNVALQAGELLQLDWSDRRHRAYVTVPPLTPSTPRGTVAFTPERAHWFHRLQADQLPLSGIARTVAPLAPAATPATLNPMTTDGGTEIVSRAALALTRPLPVERGDWLRLATGDRTLWLQVAEPPQADGIPVESVWVEGPEPTVGALSLSQVQQLRLVLSARPAEATADDPTLTVANLAGAAPHPRFVGALPTDAALLARAVGPGPTAINPYAALWAEVTHPRFPLSLELEATTTVLPLGLAAPRPWRAGLVPPGQALSRDGLVPPTADAVALTGQDWATFLPTLFLDPALRTTGLRSLAAAASDRLYLQNQALRGIHAVWAIEEVSLLALPDAAQVGWSLTAAESVTPPTPPAPPEIPDDCAPVGPFQPCVTATAAAADPPPPLPATPTTQWQGLTAAAYRDRGLLEIQQAAARMAAARADLVAILGLPKHYRLPDVLAHQRQLLPAVRRESDTADSYLALYHPWLISREPTGELIHSHPAGAMVGVMAARSLQRGAWIAPANEPLKNVLATLPAFANQEEQALYTVGVNPIRQLPPGFVAWGSLTQSLEADLEDLSVRRLLILLRRLALREGQAYVFAAHNAAFRRRVQQQFEQVLARLFDLGAFAGRVPAEAYQVVIDPTLNTPARSDRGQLIVELRIAPAQPLTFITVRLVQLDSDQLTIEEGFTNGR